MKQVDEKALFMMKSQKDFPLTAWLDVKALLVLLLVSGQKTTNSVVVPAAALFLAVLYMLLT